MNQPPPTEKQTGKRIVSKGEYMWMQAHILFLSGMLLFCGVWFVLHISDIFYREKIALFGGWRGCIQPDPTMIFVHGIFGAGLIAAAIKYLKTQQHRSTNLLREMQPLTRANTADLPAPDSLVRASAEPVQEPQAVLLRAAVQGQETPHEQLVRAAGGQESV